MTKPRNEVIVRFDEELLGKLLRALGSDNTHEAEAARAGIGRLLEKFSNKGHFKTLGWADLVQLLSIGTVSVPPDLIADIAGLGDPDPVQRAAARGRIDNHLARHRKNWNDFVEALSGAAPAKWLGTRKVDPDRVDPLALIIHVLKEYVELRDYHEYLAVALWTMHSHIYRQFMVTPRLALISPVANCGKTTLIDILVKLTARAEKFDSITTAAIFRLIDDSHPTLLIDEADNLGIALAPNGRLRAVFNSGHRSGGTIAISERGDPRKFSTFCPLALALPDASGGLPRTLNSRCISIGMQRAVRELRRLEPNRPDKALDETYEQILLWRNDPDLELDPDPDMVGMSNRFADNWRPLISIADSLPGWGKKARDAMRLFAAGFQDADPRILLLTDIRKVFDACMLDRIPTKALIDALLAMDDADWTEFRGLRGDQAPHKLKDSELAVMLREFKIRSRVIWPPHRKRETKSARGYLRTAFEQIWATYCSDEAVTPSQSGNVKGLQPTEGDT